MAQKSGTTLRIEDDIKRGLKQKLLDENTTLTQVVNDFLRQWKDGKLSTPGEDPVAKKQRALVKHMEGIRATDPVVADALESAISTIYRRLNGTDIVASAVTHGRSVAKRISRQMGSGFGHGAGASAGSNEDD